MAHALIWFRRDLRLDDNPALQAALRAVTDCNGNGKISCGCPYFLEK